MSRAKKKNNQATVKPSKNTHYPDDLVRPNYLDTPREPIEVKKPINGYDYLSALVRIPEVQKDMKVMIGTTIKKKEMNSFINTGELNIPWSCYRSQRLFTDTANGISIQVQFIF